MRLFIKLALLTLAGVAVNVVGDLLLKFGLLRPGSQHLTDFLNYVPPQNDEGVSYTLYEVSEGMNNFSVTDINRWGD